MFLDSEQNKIRFGFFFNVLLFFMLISESELKDPILFDEHTCDTSLI